MSDYRPVYFSQGVYTSNPAYSDVESPYTYIDIRGERRAPTAGRVTGSFSMSCHTTPKYNPRHFNPEGRVDA